MTGLLSKQLISHFGYCPAMARGGDVMGFYPARVRGTHRTEHRNFRLVLRQERLQRRPRGSRSKTRSWPTSRCATHRERWVLQEHVRRKTGMHYAKTAATLGRGPLRASPCSPPTPSPHLRRGVTTRPAPCDLAIRPAVVPSHVRGARYLRRRRPFPLQASGRLRL